MNAYDQVIGTATRLRIPLMAQLELTYRCNLRCLHCYARGNHAPRELSTAEVFHEEISCPTGLDSHFNITCQAQTGSKT